MRGLGLGLGFVPSAGSGSGVNYFSPGAVIDYETTDFAGFTPTDITTATGYPDEAGGTSALRTREVATTNLHGLSIPVSGTVTANYTYFADLTFDPDGRDWFLFQIAGPGNNFYAVVNPGTQTVGDSSGVTVEFRDLGSGWWHVRLTFTAAATGVVAANVFHAINGTTYSMLGDVNLGIRISRFRLSHDIPDFPEMDFSQVANSQYIPIIQSI